MQPLYNITFLLRATLLEEATSCVPATCRIGIYIDNTATFHVDNLYQILFFRQAKHSICLAVPANTISDVSLQDAMLLVFNHPQYTIIEKKPEVILVHEQEDTDTNPSAIEAFQAKALAQGWAGLHLINFFKCPYGTQKEDVFSFTISSTAALEDFFSANPFANISAVAGAHFIIQVYDVRLTPLLQNVFMKMEQTLIEKNPKIYDVYVQLMYTKNELYKTKQQLQLSNKQLNSLKRYNAILKSEEQTRRILEFYHSEYEVLPLWYKRFGHIIKVLSGKRTFKSLFQDDEKKGTK